MQVSRTGLETLFFANLGVYAVQLAVLVEHLRDFLLRGKFCFVLSGDGSVQPGTFHCADFELSQLGEFFIEVRPELVRVDLVHGLLFQVCLIVVAQLLQFLYVRLVLFNQLKAAVDVLRDFGSRTER